MGNTGLSSNVWVLDTAATIKATGNLVYLKKMVYYPNAVDNDLKVADGSGNILWELRAVVPSPNKEAVGALVNDSCEGWVDGFILVTIEGGALHVHIG
jgi:hypothetical protein